MFATKTFNNKTLGKLPPHRFQDAKEGSKPDN